LPAGDESRWRGCDFAEYCSRQVEQPRPRNELGGIAIGGRVGQRGPRVGGLLEQLE